MEEECPICRISYDLDQRTPMSLCPDQHLCCFQCFNQLLLTQDNPSCPECRHPLNSRTVRKFRHFQAYSQKLRKLKQEVQESQRQKRRLQQMLKRNRSSQDLQKQARNTFHLPRPKKASFQDSNTLKSCRQACNVKQEEDVIFSRNSLKPKVQKYLQQQDYVLAIILLMSAIEQSPKCSDQSFLGFGCRQQQQDFCEDENYQWYKRHYPNYDISFQDLLALCFLKKPDYSRQKQWYTKMTQNYPSNCRIMLGLAFTYHNSGDLTNAFSIYLELIEKEPTSPKAYEMVAFIYLSKKQMELAYKYSNLCLKIQPKNIYALFIFALSNENQPETALRLLIQLLIYQPSYRRVLKAILKIFKSEFDKKVKRIIQSSMQKRLQIPLSKGNPAFVIAVKHYNNGDYQQCIHALLKPMRNNYKQSSGRFDQSYKLLGCAYFMRKQYESSAKYFSTPEKRVETSLYFGINNFIMGNYQGAIKSTKVYLQYWRNIRGQKEMPKEYVTVLYQILYFSSNKLRNGQAVVFYNSWLNRYYTKAEKDEKQTALYYWDNILNLNRRSSLTKELQDEIEFILSHYDSLGFYCENLNEFD